MRTAEIRPELRHAWYGPSLLVVSHQRASAARMRASPGSTSGFYFRETRYLSVLRFHVNRTTPWVCALGSESQEEISRGLVYPELLRGEGGGSGVAKDDIPRDSDGILHRSIDLLVTYRVSFGRLGRPRSSGAPLPRPPSNRRSQRRYASPARTTSPPWPGWLRIRDGRAAEMGSSTRMADRCPRRSAPVKSRGTGSRHSN